MKKDLKKFYKQTIVPSLINDFGYKNIECINLKARTKKYEGCLLINTNHVKSNNEN